VDGRLIRVPFPAQWARLQIQLDLMIDQAIYSRPSRIAERAISVEFGSLDALAAAADVRPLLQFADGGPAQKLRVSLDYGLDPVETEFESFPQPTQVDTKLYWEKDMTADGWIRIDAYLANATGRFWARQLDTVALLILGAVLGLLADRGMNRE